MPEIHLNRMQALQLVLIMFAVPTQYFLYEWTGKTESSRVESIHGFSSWHIWIHQCVEQLLTKGITFKVDKRDSVPTAFKTSKTKTNQPQESIAEEVFYYRSPDGWFALSMEPRNRKSNKIKFRVGQVIKHKLFGYHGVIVGWDKTCKAPEFWIQQNHGTNQQWKQQPSYAVLVDTRYRRSPQVTYVVEENIAILFDTKIQHPSIGDYFDFYDGAQYHMRPALKKIYPTD